MAEIVDLKGQRIDAELPADCTVENTLEKLLEDIREGRVKTSRIVICVDSSTGYFIRSSRQTYAETLSLLVLCNRIVQDEILDPEEAPSKDPA